MDICTYLYNFIPNFQTTTDISRPFFYDLCYKYTLKQKRIYKSENYVDTVLRDQVFILHSR